MPSENKKAVHCENIKLLLSTEGRYIIQGKDVILDSSALKLAIKNLFGDHCNISDVYAELDELKGNERLKVSLTLDVEFETL